MEDFAQLVKASRSYRRFDQSAALSRQQLYDLAALLRDVPSAANKQALKAVLVWEEKDRAALFPLLAWAAMLEKWGGPKEGQRPTGYIVLVCDTAISQPQARLIDAGIAAQTMALAAADAGLGCCMIGSFSKEEAKATLGLAANWEPMLVLALGKPAETVVLTDVSSNGSTAYYRDSKDAHCVPKRALTDLILG